MLAGRSTRRGVMSAPALSSGTRVAVRPLVVTAVRARCARRKIGRGAGTGRAAAILEGEQGVETSELEEGTQIVVEVGETQRTIRLTNFLRQRHERAEA